MDIKSEIANIFKIYTGIDFLNEENLQNENLFGRKIGMAPRDLVEVYMEIKKKFNITIEEKIFIDRKLKTYKNFVDAIVKSANIPEND